MPATEPIPDIKDIIPPPEIADPDRGGILLICALLTSLLILSILILFWIKSRKKRIQSEPVDPRKASLDHLHTLKQRYVDLSAHEVAQETVTGLRLIIAHKFGQKSLNLTPEEFFTIYKEKIMQMLSNEDKERLLFILHGCDRLRFAPEKEDSSERLPLIEKTIHFVSHIPNEPLISSTNNANSTTA
jgi:hypothetical protein